MNIQKLLGTLNELYELIDVRSCDRSLTDEDLNRIINCLEATIEEEAVEAQK